MGVICVKSLKEANLKHFKDRTQSELLEGNKYGINNNSSKISHIFNSISSCILSALPYDPLLVELVVIEFVISCDKTAVASLRKSEYKLSRSLNFLPLDLISIEQELGDKFLEVYQSMKALSLTWNKSRFFLAPSRASTLNHFFEYKFDVDLLWAQSINPDSVDYKKLFDIEDSIMDWEGVPPDYFKSWIH